MVETGETYKQLAEIKYSMEDSVKQNFIEPLQHLQNKDLKEVNVRAAACMYNPPIISRIFAEVCHHYGAPTIGL